MKRRRGRKRKKLLGNLKERREYCQFKEEALDRTIWRNLFGRRTETFVWQITDDDVCAQHVSDINISTISTSLQTHTTKHSEFSLTLNHPSLEKKTPNVLIKQHRRKLLTMNILMSETC